MSELTCIDLAELRREAEREDPRYGFRHADVRALLEVLDAACEYRAVSTSSAYGEPGEIAAKRLGEALEPFAARPP